MRALIASTRARARPDRLSKSPAGARAAQVLRLGQDQQGADCQRGDQPYRHLVRRGTRDQWLAITAARAVRTESSRPLISALESWFREQRGRVSKISDTGKAVDYSLKRWTELTRFLTAGRLCMTNDAAERELRAVAVGRRNWTFAGSDEGGRRGAAIYTLIATAKLNDIDPQAWLADVLTRLPDHPARRIGELSPWAWRAEHRAAA